MATKMQTRHVALAWALYFAEQLKVRESGANNHGALVEAIQEADTLPGKFYAWCQSTQNAMWRLATGGRLVRTPTTPWRFIGGSMLAGGTASVGQFASWAVAKGYVVKRPLRGDYFCMQLTADNWPDHVGQVVKVLSLRPFGYFLCRTVEGNTGSSSIDDGDGMFVKTRLLRASRTIFVRVPGTLLNPHLPPTGK